MSATRKTKPDTSGPREARREVETLRAEVERLKARTAVTCKCASVVMGYTPGYVVVQSFCDYSVAARVDCPACKGSGAVIVEAP